MRGRRSRARKAVSKAPTRRTTPTKRSRTKVRRSSRPVTPPPKPVARRKPTPPKPVVRKKPVSKADIRGEKTNTLRRTIMPVPRKKPTQPKPVARRKPTPVVRKKPSPPKPVARKRPTAPKVPESIQKRIEDIIAARTVGSRPDRIPTKRPKPAVAKKKAAPKPKKAAPKKTAAKKKAPSRPPLPPGVAKGGRYYDNPVTGEPMYQPPMPNVGPGRVQSMVMPDPINLVTGRPERGTISIPSRTTAAIPAAPTPAAPAPTPPVVRPTDGVQSGSFESRYVNWLASKPTKPRRPGGMGAASKKYQARRKKYESDFAKWQASKPVQPLQPSQSIPPVVTPAPTPAPPPPTMGPILTNEPNPDLPPRFKDRFVRPMSPLGTPDMLIASNIVGQSFDPSAAMPPMPPQPPGSVFGGYGQQAPMQATAPFAGMAQANPTPIDFFPGAVPNRPTPRPDAEPVM